MRQTGLIFVISAPSGSGKTTLCNELLSGPLKLVASVSLTTRPPRQGEKQGEDYFFVSREEFESRRKKGEFVEWAEVYGNFYGTPAGFVEKTIAGGDDILLSIDVKGAMQVKERYPGACLVFILPPSMQALEERLRGRLTEDSEEIAERLEIARLELSYLPRYNYAVVNEEVPAALEKLKAIVAAERCRVGVETFPISGV